MKTNADSASPLDIPRPVCGQRYRVLIDGLDGLKWSGTRHCKKPKGHKGKCANAANAQVNRPQKAAKGEQDEH